MAVQYLSAVKSPQQVAGALLKNLVYPSYDADNTQNCCFIAVMPCYDKKIESFRAEFERAGVKEVDMVLTTTEF